MEPSKAASDNAAAAAFWDGLHRIPRFRPQYPSEHVVRFLRTLPQEVMPEHAAVRALDIGCGGGRHSLLLAELGFSVEAVDISAEGLRHTGELLAAIGHTVGLTVAPMTALPFPDETFDVAVSYGVFNYGTAAEGRAAVAELHRVLLPGGRALVVARSTDDYRCGRGTALETQTFRAEDDETNERGTVQHFLSERDVEERYSAFGKLSFELTETTFRGRSAKNSDWLVTVEK